MAPRAPDRTLGDPNLKICGQDCVYPAQRAMVGLEGTTITDLEIPLTRESRTGHDPQKQGQILAREGVDFQWQLVP